MSLSKGNYKKLDINYLYRKEPVFKDNYTNSLHCKNWTFKIEKDEKDGEYEAWMVDTYWSSGSNTIKVTDENIDDFELIFDFREVMQISDSASNEYNKSDVYFAATGSGGYSYGGCYWVKKDAHKSLDLLIQKKKRELISVEWSLKSAQRELQNLLAKEANPNCTCDPGDIIYSGCRCKKLP